MRRRYTLLGLAVVGLIACGAARAGAPAAGPTDITKLARQFPRHKDPTVLWVNFDGWRNYYGKKDSIQPFRSTTSNRDRDVQLILFRTAEMYAPFDVQVIRAFGDARFDRRPLGNTTIFVGANTANVLKGKKFVRGHTPGKYADNPGVTRGDRHRPNSDPYDLGFVDPDNERGQGWDIITISGTIAHEAGHTFGLAHTLTKPAREVMSYDAPNRCFTNRTFQITDLNQTPNGLVHDKGVLPGWRGTRIVTQNSFTYLRAVLGARPPDDNANVADADAVDPSYRDGSLRDVAPRSAVRGAVERRGDYDVFRVRQAAGQRLAVRVRPSAGGRLTPVLLVFDELGRELLDYDNGRGRNGRAAQVVLPARTRAYKVVVGAADGASQGPYELSASAEK
jgi:hypothetical protein